MKTTSESAEAADAVQEPARDSDCRAKARLGHAQPQAQEGVGQEVDIDAHSRQRRPSAAASNAIIKAGDRAGAWATQLRDDPGKVGRSDQDVAVDEDEGVVLGALQ